MAAYYNEIDSYCVAWLQNLIKAKLIAEGDVDSRSITEVSADDIKGYTQCHFFAGIAGWSYALRLAGISDDQQVWTGSCPCQPFSNAGKRKGFDDERHLWPEFARLIAARRPQFIIGEQVASKLGRQWFGGDACVQRMLDREAVIGVLQRRDIIEGLPHDLQNLLLCGRTDSQSEDSRGETRGRLPPLAAGESRCSASEGRGPPSKAARGSMYARSGGYPEDDRERGVSVDGYSVQPRGRPYLGQPVARQDQQPVRLYAGEYTGRSVLHQCDGEHVGREQDCRDFGGNYGGEAQSFGGLSDALRNGAEEKNKFGWYASVRSDLEALGYAVGAADLCAASIGAPHIRQRLWWAAYPECYLREPWRSGAVSSVEHSTSEQVGLSGCAREQGSAAGELGNSRGKGRRQVSANSVWGGEGSGAERLAERSLHECDGGPWSELEWLPCIDGKWRPVKSGIFPLAHGVSGRMVARSSRQQSSAEIPEENWYSRVGALRAFGNAIVPQVAAEFIKAAMSVAP